MRVPRQCSEGHGPGQARAHVPYHVQPSAWPRSLAWATSGWLVAVGLTLQAASQAVAVESGGVAAHARGFLSDYCVGCHGNEKQRAEVNLEQYQDEGRFGENRELWEKVRNSLEAREMPPENKRQPAEEDRQAMVRYLEAELAKAEAALPPNPGRVTLRRLNRNEFRNTVRDLLAVDFDAHGQFPNDESGYGFDNIGDVLSLPPMLLEKYLAAAEDIAGRAILTRDPALRRVKRLPADRFSTQADAISTLEEETWGFYREGEIVARHEFAKPGDYLLRLRAYGEQAGTELPKMSVRLDDQEVAVRSIRAVAERPESFEVPIRVTAGVRKLGVAYLNNFNSDGDRNLFLTSFEVVGPLGGPAEDYPESHRRVLPAGRPAPGGELAAATEALRSFAGRAYRRPATDDEVARLVRLVELTRKEGGSFEEGVQLAVEAVLVSPRFLYRWELDPEVREPGGARDLNDYEVASRLSYFLWSSMPDAELFATAARGELLRPEVLEAQVRRMLRDPKSEALVQNFGGQWLQVRNLDQVEPDATIFPGWGPELRESMRRETELFLRAIVQEDRGVYDLVAADFTFVDERLARHYGLPGVEGREFRRVRLTPEFGRGGVVTMGSVLTITSVPTRTSPVLRGKWILEQILGTPPPPPPPNVPPIEAGAEAIQAATMRQRLEVHRSKPDCLPCHQKMDPLGFALENFDAVGAWRDMDGPHPVDNAAELPGGRKFSGAAGLKTILAASEDFPRALSSKLLTYALGRGLEFNDRPAIRGILDALSKNDFKFSALVLGVVRSEPFLKRQTAPLPHETDEHASLHP